MVFKVCEFSSVRFAEISESAYVAGTESSDRDGIQKWQQCRADQSQDLRPQRVWNLCFQCWGACQLHKPDGYATYLLLKWLWIHWHVVYLCVFDFVTVCKLQVPSISKISQFFSWMNVDWLALWLAGNIGWMVLWLPGKIGWLVLRLAGIAR